MAGACSTKPSSTCENDNTSTALDLLSVPLISLVYEIHLPIVGSPYWMAPEVLKGQLYNEKADVFSFGIILCEITARIDADPDILPRTENFGLDYIAFSEMVEYCPLDFLHLAFRCCQIDPKKRPSFVDNMECLLQMQRGLNNTGNTAKNIKDCKSSCKRSKSEDNILDSCNWSSMDDDPTMTAKVIGQTMSEADPFYIPARSNPFTMLNKFCDGKKVVGIHRDMNLSFDLPSPSSPFTPPCTPITPDNFPHPKRSVGRRKCQSLPGSPILLRQAAERFHQESIHGSSYQRDIDFSLDLVSNLGEFFFNTHMNRFQNNNVDKLSDIMCSNLHLLKDSDSAVDLKSSPIESPKSRLATRRKAFRSKQRSVECSLLFSNTCSEKESSVPKANQDCNKCPPSLTICPVKGHQESDTVYLSPQSSVESFISIDESIISQSSSISNYNEAVCSDVSSLCRHEYFYNTSQSSTETASSVCTLTDTSTYNKLVLEHTANNF